MSEKVRLGFIGCGGIIQLHLDQGLKDFDDVEFAAWCDLNEDTARERKDQVGGHGEVYSDPSKMLDSAQLDAVFIALPPFAHGDVEDLVLEHRLPFFIEKPVAIDIATAKRVNERVKELGLITSVGYMNRYRSSIQRVKELLVEQKPVFAHGGWTGGGPKEESPIWNWWTRKERSGGQFLEQSTHTTDLLRYLFGDVTKVYAAASRNRRSRPDSFNIEDASMVQMSFDSGAIANIYSSCCTPLAGGISLVVHGTDFRASFSGWEHSGQLLTSDGEQTLVEDNIIFNREDRAFVDAVKLGNPSGVLATYEDGYRATVISCAANESMESGEKIDISY